jgi:hypothetical protein
MELVRLKSAEGSEKSRQTGALLRYYTLIIAKLGKHYIHWLLRHIRKIIIATPDIV